MRSFSRFLLCLLSALLAVGLVLSPLAPVSAAGPTPTPTTRANPSPTPTPGGGADNAEAITARLDPAIDADAFAPGQPLVVRFSQPVDPHSAAAPLLTDPYLSGEAAWSDGSQTLTFTPEGGFLPGMTYQVYIDPGLTGADGEVFDPLPSWSLRTLSAPRVTSISPQSGLIQDTQPVIRLSFDRAMDADSVASGLSVVPQAPLDIKWTAQTLEITPREHLALENHYQFSLSGSVVDTQGVALGEDARWDYWVDGFRASVPEVRSNSFRIRFNYPIATEESGLPFRIEPELAGKWAWVDNISASFTADDILAAIPAYTISFTGPLKNMVGGEYPAPAAVTVEPIPAVSAYGPADSGDSSISLQTNIWMSFFRAADEKSVEAAFSTTPAVKGAFTWGDKKVTFSPSEPFPANTKITVTLKDTALDKNGQPLLSKPFTWTFESGWDEVVYETPNVSFGQIGANGQVLNVDGRRAVQFLNEEQAPAIFNLYRIEPGDFAGLYKQHFGQRYWYQNQGRGVDTNTLEKIATWPVESTHPIQETLLPAETGTGTYLLTIGADGRQGDQLFLIVTSYKLVLKRSGERIWVWATDFKGNNVEDLHIRLYTDSGSIMREGDTDAEGIFSTSLPKDDEPMLVTAMSKDGDMTAAGLSYEWQGYNNSDWWWGSSYRGLQPARFYRGYLYTERPIYRPGQTVFYKAVVRGDDDIHYTLPGEGAPVVVRLLDARGNEVQRQELVLNEFGTLYGSFTLGDGAMLGEYTIEGIVEGETFQRIFKVQEYRKPDYAVELHSDANAYVDGDTIKVDIDTRYFFGEPVSGAGLTGQVYMLYQKGYDSWWEDIDFKTDPLQAGDFVWFQKAFTMQGKTSDENGHATLSFTANVKDNLYSCRSSWRSSLRECYVGIEVTAREGSGQVVTASKVIRVYSSPVKYSMDTGDWMKRPGEGFDVTVSAVDIQGKPAAEQKVSIAVWGYTDGWERRALTTFNGKTGTDGKIVVPLQVDEEGYYEVLLTDLGHSSSSVNEYHQISDWIYVSGSQRRWSKASYGEFTITAERSQYKPYERAKLMIISPFDGPALLTFERGQVIHTRPVMLTAPLTEVEVEIIPEDAPNVYVVVNAWKGEYQTLAQAMEGQDEFYTVENLRDARLYRAEVELQVDAGANRLNVAIEPDQEQYAPRQEANLAVRVTNAQGKPVQAELSVALVDEAIYALSDDLSGPIFDAFYGRRAHNVFTFDSLALRRYMYDNSGRGGGGGDAASPPSGPRSNFQDTAFWLPEVRTNANGEAIVKVTLPDNLTSWRVVVKAVTASTQVGEANANILTQKEVLVRPTLPQELVIGDTAALTAMVHNYGAQPRDLVVTLEADGLELAGGPGDAGVTVRVAAGGVQPVTWQVKAAQTGDLPLTIRAAGQDGEEDAVQLVLPVRQRAMPAVTSQAGDFQGEYTGVLALPPHLLPGSTAELKISRSIGGNVLDGLAYLTGYPYGCVEQTMSRALPNAVVGRALDELGLDQPGLAQELPELINAGLQRLYGYQHNDGGWGWWYDDDTDAYQSAWVVFGLAITREAGYPVDEKVIERGAAYLQEQLTGGESGRKLSDRRTRAYVLYSLARAGYGDREQTLALVEYVHELDPFSQAGLALALHALGEEEKAQTVLEIIDMRVQIDEARAFWPADRIDGHYHDKTMSSTVRSTALALSAYLQIAPDHERIPQIVRYLMGQRRAEGWGSTNETAYTLLALTDYLLLTQQNEGDIDFQVLLNDAALSSGTLQPGDPALAIALPVEKMRTGPNIIKIVQTGEGRLYYNLTSRVFQDLPFVNPSGTVQITREYLDAKTSKPVTQAQPGQLVRVRLSIKGSGDTLSYVMIEDHLPAGLEAINDQLNNTSHDSTQEQVWDDFSGTWMAGDFLRWRDFGYNNKEIRGARVSFFITSLPTGKEKVIAYMTRATQSGAFTALPAEFSAMYDAGVWGHSGSAVIEVGEAE